MGERVGDCRAADLDVSDSDYGLEPVDGDSEEGYLKSKEDLKCCEMFGDVAGKLRYINKSQVNKDSTHKTSDNKLFKITKRLPPI